MNDKRGKGSPGASAYYEALSSVFDLEARVLTAVLPHMGERGANDEERCREFLKRVLPQKYSIGTGFVVSATVGSQPSRQQDVVVYDGFLNSPLHAELSASVFPVEMVYATLEVKGRLDREELRKALESVGRTRSLSHQSRYEELLPYETAPGRYKLREFTPIKRPPAGFIFAYDTTYETLDGFKNAVQEVIDEVKTAHLHGIVVLSQNWFAFQKPFTTPTEVVPFGDNALMRFVTNLLAILRATHITPAAVHHYLKIETSPPDEGTS